MAGGGVQVTSVPTWLPPVLGALLAALVSGFAALLGVLLGGRAARRTAAHTASLAREDEQRRWTRERRERSYASFLESRNRYVAAQIVKGDVMQEWARGAKPEEPGPDLLAERRAVDESLQAVQRRYQMSSFSAPALCDRQ
jgi:hypothetical protein